MCESQCDEMDKELYETGSSVKDALDDVAPANECDLLRNSFRGYKTAPDCLPPEL